MKTYQVSIEHTAIATYTIEAADEDEARELAWEVYDPADADNCAGADIFDIEELEDA